MKILFVSDAESRYNFEKLTYEWNYTDKKELNNIDLIISCGDLKPEYLIFLKNHLNKPLFYVHGNHDSVYKHREPSGCTSIDGEIIDFNGMNIVGLGGSNKYNSDIHQYSEGQMQGRIYELKDKLSLIKKIDVVVTHSPPYKLGDGEDLCHKGFQCFIDLIDNYNPKYFMHGHMHLDYTNTNSSRFNIYKGTKIINTFKYYILDIDNET